MTKDTTGKSVGLDLSDRESTYVVLDDEGKVKETGKVETSAPALRKLFGGMSTRVVALEVGTHSPWVSRLLHQLGHHVVVANPRQLQLITRSQKKNDRNDAEKLARLARVDECLLAPVAHRSEAAQLDLAVIQARAQLVEVRTKLINHVRGTVKAYGARLPGCSAAAFANKMAELIPEGLQGALLEVVDEIGQLSVRIGRYDRRITRLAQESYPESKLLQQVPGVGALTAVSYILVLGDRRRFARSRQVGAYLGLVPRQQQSGERSPELHITRAGDAALRRLLVQGAHYIMGPFGPDTQLRRWGLKMAGEGSSARKKRAIVAVARKLAVLLHRLWTTAEVYEPFHGEGRVVVAA